MTPQYSEAKDIASHEARITNLEKWIARVDDRYFTLLLSVIATLATSVGSLLLLWLKK